MRACVITGASSSGKTTIINYLDKLGFAVMHEVARDVLEEGHLHPHKNIYDFQEEVAKRHIAKEEELRSNYDNKIVFFDRGIYDNIAFCRYFGMKRLPKPLNKNIHYDTVFVLDQLDSFEHDGTRIEKDFKEALDIKKMIVNEYKKRGIECVNVPIMPTGERVNFILNYLSLAKNIILA